MLAVGVSLSSGCDPWSHEEPLRLGLIVWPPYELAHLARARGYYDPERIRLVDYRSPAELTRAYRHGLVDVVAITTEYFIRLRARDDSHRIIMVVDISQGGDALVARPDVETGPDLEGRRVGLEASALGAHVLLQCLSRHGLSPSDVDTVPVDIPDQTAAFLGGQVDAVVTYEPIRTRLLAEGARELCSSRELGDDIVDVLITRDATVADRRADLRHLVHGWQRALQYLRAHPLEAAAHMAPREGLAPDGLLRALEGAQLGDRSLNAHLLQTSPPRLETTLVRIRDRFVRHGLVASTFSLERSIEPGVLQDLP